MSPFFYREEAEDPYANTQYTPRARTSYQPRQQNYQSRRNKPVPRENNLYDDSYY